MSQQQVQRQGTERESAVELKAKNQRDEELLDKTDELLASIDETLDRNDEEIEEVIDELVMAEFESFIEMMLGVDIKVHVTAMGCGDCINDPDCPLHAAAVAAAEAKS